MEEHITQGEQNLLLLENQFPKGEKFYVWLYDTAGEMIDTSCPEEERGILEQAFRLFGGLEQAIDYAGESNITQPMLLGSPIGMQWAVTTEPARGKNYFFVIGPVFYAPPVERQLREAMRPYTHKRQTALWALRLYPILSDMPVISYSVFTRYVIMVHNALTGEQTGIDALRAPLPETEEVSSASPPQRDRNKVYLSERAMLQMVRNGDISYQDVLQSSISLSPGVPIQGQEPLRQMKTNIVVFTSLVCRAAIEGGLSPEISYPLGDSYIQAAENCHDSGELSALAAAMYHDFVYRVHHLRTNPDYSYAIQKCCDYIELSLERKIRVADLAKLAGYSEYYLTQKFKKETGQSVNSYIHYAKIERAKLLLESTDLAVKEVADRLAFNTVNYFIQSFRETTGYSPAQYRKKFQK